MSTVATVSLAVAVLGFLVAFCFEVRLIARERRVGVGTNLPLLAREALVASVMPWSLVRFWAGFGAAGLVALAASSSVAWLPMAIAGLTGVHRSKKPLDFHRRGFGPNGRPDPRNASLPRPPVVVLRSWWGMLGGALLTGLLFVLTHRLGAVVFPEEGFLRQALLAAGLLLASVALPMAGAWVLGRSLFTYVRLEGTHVVTRGDGHLVAIPVERVVRVGSEHGLRVHTDDGAEYPALSLFGSRIGRWTSGGADRRRAERVTRFVDQVRPDMPEGFTTLPRELRRRVVVRNGSAMGAGMVWTAFAFHVIGSGL
ncbi:hypothetical protein HNR06_003044 [Nocardiopsis arvandica]|uniref:PH domain-containing protein n=1 Tax=Nocardiopsis sinuspersici TaxID=501010 RepID=A0A7Y9XEU5_9ACTN|nr:hypothetical protein [Nocardiopsis sinuspersici]NYH53455.1 hypothetical protein [Nocardiopsis sinuspersici]